MVSCTPFDDDGAGDRPAPTRTPLSQLPTWVAHPASRRLHHDLAACEHRRGAGGRADGRSTRSPVRVGKGAPIHLSNGAPGSPTLLSWDCRTRAGGRSRCQATRSLGAQRRQALHVGGFVPLRRRQLSCNRWRPKSDSQSTYSIKCSSSNFRSGSADEFPVLASHLRAIFDPFSIAQSSTELWLRLRFRSIVVPKSDPSLGAKPMKLLFRGPLAPRRTHAVLPPDLLHATRASRAVAKSLSPASRGS